MKFVRQYNTFLSVGSLLQMVKKKMKKINYLHKSLLYLH